MSHSVIPAKADEKVAAMAIAWEIVSRTVANDKAKNNSELADVMTMAFIKIFEDIYETVADEFEIDLDDDDFLTLEYEDDDDDEEFVDDTPASEPAPENGADKKKKSSKKK